MAPGPEAQLTRSRRFRRNTESLKVCPGLGQIVKLRRTLNPISKWQVPRHYAQACCWLLMCILFVLPGSESFAFPFRVWHCYTSQFTASGLGAVLRLNSMMRFVFRVASAMVVLGARCRCRLSLLWPGFLKTRSLRGCGICLLETTRALTICPYTARYTEFELHNKL